MRFSILLNSRGRVALLSDLFLSLLRTTQDHFSVEVIVCYDTDDSETMNFLKYCEHPNLRPLECEPGRNLHANLNEAYKISQGEFILGLNDDCVMQHLYWDFFSYKQLCEYLTDKPDGIVYGRTHDTSVDKGGTKEYASFPILSRQAVETQGFFMPEKFTGWGADVWTWRVYNSVGRVCDIPTVLIDHVEHNSLDKVYNPDSTQQRIRRISNLHSVDCFSCDISAEVEKLKCAIGC